MSKEVTGLRVEWLFIVDGKGIGLNILFSQELSRFADEVCQNPECVEKCRR